MSKIQPPEASTEDTTIPPDTTITDSAGQAWSLGASDVVGHRLLRDGLQFADGQGELLLFHDQTVFTRNSRSEWFVATTEWQPIPGDPRPQRRDLRPEPARPARRRIRPPIAAPRADR